MNSFKPLCFFAFTLLALTSCSTSRQFSTYTPVSAPLNITKKAPLTEKDLMRWSHLDIVKDTIPGMSVDKAYAELLKNKKGKKVIVAILDSGVDIEHPDLKPVIWTNKKEIAGNGIDDDKNGYIDDIHGWNFLGDITKENYEFDRILGNKKLVNEVIYQEAKVARDKQFEKSTKAKIRTEQTLANIIESDAVLAKHLGKSVYTVDDLKAIVSQETEIKKSKEVIEKILSGGTLVAEEKKSVQKQLDDYNSFLNGDDAKINFRKVLNDNPNDITDTKYGNNNVTGELSGSLHGTHVAGIVAQTRNNDLGGDGISNNVEILTVRAVPMGDEYDKDIALGIRYAVDNGAKIINGSFGKAILSKQTMGF